MEHVRRIAGLGLRLVSGSILLCLPSCTHTPPTPAVPPASSPLRGERVTEGPLDQRLLTDDADLVIFYGGEHRGSMEACGCQTEQKGSLPRFASYVRAAMARNPGTPSILLYGGRFLEDAITMGGTLRGDVPLANRWILRGMKAMAFDAINVGSNDLPGLADLGASASSLPLTSANIVPTEGAPVPATDLFIHRGGFTVHVVGISSPGFQMEPVPQYQVLSAQERAAQALSHDDPEADGSPRIDVLLAFQAIDDARELAKTHREIDVIVDTASHRETIEPFRVGNAVWVKSAFETQRVGELRLWIEGDRVVSALDRKIDMDPDIPADPDLEPILEQARIELIAMQRELYGP